MYAGYFHERDPRLSFLARVLHVVQCCRELQDRGRRGPAVLRCDVMSVLRPELLQQDSVSLARVHNNMSSGPRSLQKAIVNVVASLVLPWQELVSRRGGPTRPDPPGGGGRRSRHTTRSALTACLSISQHSLMKSRCVLACCCSGLWSSFTHWVGFL